MIMDIADIVHMKVEDEPNATANTSDDSSLVKEIVLDSTSMKTESIEDATMVTSVLTLENVGVVSQPVNDQTPQPTTTIKVVKRGRPTKAMSTPKTLPRGSIVYEHTPSGEIIAKIIRNGDQLKKTPTTTTTTTSKKPATKAARQDKLLLGAEDYQCPITEENVDNVLERTLLVTESLQQLLNTFKDDLKRVGGGPHMTPNIKPVNVKKRLEVADKLTKAYINYQQAIDDIGELGRNTMAAFMSDAEIERMQTAQIIHTPVVKPAALSKVKKTPAGTGTPAQTKSSIGSKQKIVPAEPVGSNVSDDLWMSCEPGSDDESLYNVGFPKYNRKK